MTMKRLFTLVLAAGCASVKPITADGTTPLPNGSYTFSQNIVNSNTILSGRVTILGDSIAVEPEKPCPTTFGADRRSMSLACTAYKINVQNRGGVWALSYSVDGFNVEERRVCKATSRMATGPRCDHYATERVEIPTVISGALPLYVVDTSHASKRL